MSPRTASSIDLGDNRLLTGYDKTRDGSAEKNVGARACASTNKDTRTPTADGQSASGISEVEQQPRTLAMELSHLHAERKEHLRTIQQLQEYKDRAGHKYQSLQQAFHNRRDIQDRTRRDLEERCTDLSQRVQLLERAESVQHSDLDKKNAEIEQLKVENKDLMHKLLSIVPELARAEQKKDAQIKLMQEQISRLKAQVEFADRSATEFQQTLRAMNRD